MARQTHYQGILGGTAGQIRGQSTKTDNYTVVAKDTGLEFLANGSGAITFTLPALAPGLWFKFRNLADQNMVIAAATANTIVGFNDAAADSVTFSTSGEKIGATAIFYTNADGTKWFYDKPCRNTDTLA